MKTCDDHTAVQVAVAVVRDHQGRVLITRRHADAHQGGLWEFPGGKLEPGESLGDALRRELREELGIDIESHEPLLQIAHDYGDKSVELMVCEVVQFQGTPTPCEGQPMQWVSVGRLREFDFPAANQAIVSALDEKANTALHREAGAESQE